LVYWLRKIEVCLGGRLRGHDEKKCKSVRLLEGMRGAMLSAHECGLLKFLEPQQVLRVQVLLDRSAKQPRKFFKMLAHDIRLHPKYSRRMPDGQQSAAKLCSELMRLGAPSVCYVVAEVGAPHEAQLEAAFRSCVGRGLRTSISCIPGRLGYYEFESAGERYILERR
jgi:hypothetical protein